MDSQQRPSAFAPLPAAGTTSAFPGLQPDSVVTPPQADQQGQQPAPGTAAEPQGQQAQTPPQPEQAQTPQYNPTEIERLRQAAARGAQLENEVRAFAATTARAQREQQEFQRVQSMREQIYQVARTTMEPAAGMDYIRQAEDRLHAEHLGRMRQIEQEAERDKWMAVSQVAAPLYAQQLAREHDLPTDMMERLNMMAPQQMDAQLPLLLREKASRLEQDRKTAELQSQIDQLIRAQAANDQAQSGAHEMGGAGASPIPSQQGEYRPGSLDHLMSMPGMRDIFKR